MKFRYEKESKTKSAIVILALFLHSNEEKLIPAYHRKQWFCNRETYLDKIHLPCPLYCKGKRVQMTSKQHPHLDLCIEY